MTSHSSIARQLLEICPDLALHIARCTEQAYRRGYQQGALYGHGLDQQVSAWRFDLPADHDHDTSLQRQALPPEAAALQQQIQQLEGMRDPELQPVLAAKRKKLAQMVAATQGSAGLEADAFLAQVAAFQLPELGAASEADPLNTRRLLSRFVSAEASGGELVTISVAPAICLPGRSGTLYVEGLGLGRPPEQQSDGRAAPAGAP